MVNALDTQVAGGHYKDMKIQPIEFGEANKLSPCQFSVVKYICRHKNKNGIEDLKKARHFIALLAQLEYGVNIVELEEEERGIKNYLKENCNDVMSPEEEVAWNNKQN